MSKEIDVCVVTYNRLSYLQKCVWSIIASTRRPYRIHVIDDGSTDGSREWLQYMKESGKIFNYIFNEENLGSAGSLNKVIDSTETQYITVTFDDMYFHRGWDETVFGILRDYKDSGLISFYNYPFTKFDTKIDDRVWKVVRTGIGAALINKELYEKAGKFILPYGRKMGWFTTPFCNRCNHVDIPRNKHYVPVMPYVTNMDEPQCRLNERNAQGEYIAMRQREKKGWGL